MNKQEGFIDHIVSFTSEEVLEFLTKNKDEKFYAFAFDVNPETYGIYLSFNTEAEFNKKLAEYKAGEYGEYYGDLDNVNRLRYNPGDWKYQNFVSIEFIYHAKIKELFDVVLDADTDSLLKYAERAMTKFKKSEAYRLIPKEKDFIAFCIDHDEDELLAISRTLSIN